MKINRLFTELTPEVDYTAQLYAVGYEKKEIAELKCRSTATINNQIQTSFDVLSVRNGRELSILYSKRIAETVIAIFLLMIINIDIYKNTSDFYRRSERTSIWSRHRSRKYEDFTYEPLLI